MPTYENQPLSKRTGLAVTLAIIALAWYAISSGWLNFEMSRSDIDRRKAKASRMVEKVGVPPAIELQPNIALDRSGSNHSK